jgi:signal recognition particle GTPase
MLSTTLAIKPSHSRKKIKSPRNNPDIIPVHQNKTGTEISETAEVKLEKEVDEGLSCVICIGSTGAGKSATISKW